PVTYTAWAVQRALFQRYWGTWGDGGNSRQSEARLYHTVNLVLHAANTLLVFHLLLALGGVGWAALAGALLFGVHPVQVEPIAWISGLKDVLSGFFSLLCLNVYLSAGRRLRDKEKGAASRYSLAAFLYA